MVYKWKFQPKGNVPAQTAGEELERIMSKNDGKLTALAILTESRAQSSVLHNCFEWDDAIAGEKYRKHQAQYIIVQLVTEEQKQNSDEKIQVRALVSIEDEEIFYTSVKSAMSDAKMRHYVLRKAWKDLQDWKRKYKDLKEFAKIFDIIDGLGDGLG